MPAESESPLDWKTYGLALADTLKRVRTRLEMSQDELAERSGYSRTYVQNLEASRGPSDANPTMQTMYRLAHALGVPVIVLMPSIGLVPQRRYVAVDVVQSGLRIDVEPYLHAAAEHLAAERR